jgi:hypothetical protein
MLEALPIRAFFRFEFPIQYMPKLPLLDGNIDKWEARYALPPLIELEDEEALADVYAAWNEDFLLFAFDVPHRTQAFRCDPKQWWKGDGLRLCIDTRDTRENKRASRFCHYFYVLPAGGGKDGSSPVVGLHRMSRSKEPPPVVDESLIRTAVHRTKRQYSVEVVIPAACLNGWEPAEHPRIGLFYKFKDLQLGQQHLSVDDELGWNVDPSTWATAVLSR